MFLFSDMILLARPPSKLRKKYELRQEISLSGALKVAQTEGTALEMILIRACELRRVAGSKAALVVSDATRTLFAMRGLTAEEMRDWQKSIEATLQERVAVGSPRQRRE